MVAMLFLSKGDSAGVMTRPQQATDSPLPAAGRFSVLNPYTQNPQYPHNGSFRGISAYYAYGMFPPKGAGALFTRCNAEDRDCAVPWGGYSTLNAGRSPGPFMLQEKDCERSPPGSNLCGPVLVICMGADFFRTANWNFRIASEKKRLLDFSCEISLGVDGDKPPA